MTTVNINPDQAESDDHATSAPVRAMVRTFALDIGLPIGAYYVSMLLGASTYLALLIGTLISGGRLIWVSVRDRRVEIFSLFLMVVFVAGFASSLVTGDARFVLAKDSVLSGVVAVAFLGSCVVGRPLAYYAAKRFRPASGQSELENSATTEQMRKRWMKISLVWGFGLLADAVLRVVAIYALPISTAAMVSQGLTVAAFTLLISWSIWTAKRGASARSHG